MSTPGDIKTTPFDALWFNGPFDEFLKARIRLTNGGVRRIGFHLKSTVGPDRIEIDPAIGCLDPSETATLWVTIKPFSDVNTSSDRVTIEWTDSPFGAAKEYSRDWFTGDAIVRRKNIALKYNDLPGTQQPGTQQPGTPQPGTPQPGTSQPDMSLPETPPRTPPGTPPPVPPNTPVKPGEEVKTDDDKDDDSLGDPLPSIAIKPPPFEHPSFITNREFTPSLLVFATFCFLVYGVQWTIVKNPACGFVAAIIVAAFMGEWERRARYTLGRVRQRAHFDPLNLVKLPNPLNRVDIDMEALKPFISHEEKKRADPADILKRAQETVGGGAGPSEGGGGARSAMELALINMLKKAALVTAEEKKDKSAAARSPISKSNEEREKDKDVAEQPPAAEPPK